MFWCSIIVFKGTNMNWFVLLGVYTILRIHACKQKYVSDMLFQMNCYLRITEDQTQLENSLSIICSELLLYCSIDRCKHYWQILEGKGCSNINICRWLDSINSILLPDRVNEKHSAETESTTCWEILTCLCSEFSILYLVRTQHSKLQSVIAHYRIKEKLEAILSI